jgi:hypothetical protein
MVVTCMVHLVDHVFLLNGFLRESTMHQDLLDFMGCVCFFLKQKVRLMKSKVGTFIFDLSFNSNVLPILRPKICPSSYDCVYNCSC